MNVCIMLIYMLISMLICAYCAAQHSHRLQRGGVPAVSVSASY